MIELKDNTPCVDCGQSFPYYVMQFDHEPGTKSFAFDKVGTGFNPVTWFELYVEVAKCEVVCANCHMVREHERRQATRAA